MELGDVGVGGDLEVGSFFQSIGGRGGGRGGDIGGNIGGDIGGDIGGGSGGGRGLTIVVLTLRSRKKKKEK